MLKPIAPVALVAFALALEGAFLLQVVVGAPARSGADASPEASARGPGLRGSGEASPACAEGGGETPSHPPGQPAGSQPVALCGPGVEVMPLPPRPAGDPSSAKSADSRDAGVPPGCGPERAAGAGIARECG